jgi:uncharacterized protein
MKIPGNYFAPQAYVRSDLQSALLQDRTGERLIALPESFLLAMDETFHQETGKAAPFALYTCGSFWGEGFCQRFHQTLERLHRKTITQISLIDYLLAMRQVFATHGFGILDLDFAHYNHNLIVASISKSIVAPNTIKGRAPACHLEAGIFAGWFSILTAQRFGAVQTECISQGANSNRFVLLEAERLAEARRAVSHGASYTQLIAQLSAPVAPPTMEKIPVPRIQSSVLR